MKIPIVSGVAAGRAVLPENHTDWEITGFRDVWMTTVDNLARFAAVLVDGHSLTEQGILDGDLLIMRITQDYEDGKLGIWQTPDGRTAKFASHDPDGFVVLHNDDGWRQTWASDELRLLGLVVRVERDME